MSGEIQYDPRYIRYIGETSTPFFNRRRDIKNNMVFKHANCVMNSLANEMLKGKQMTVEVIIIAKEKEV